MSTRRPRRTGHTPVERITDEAAADDLGITREEFAALVDEAEQGYDVDSVGPNRREGDQT